MSVRQGERFKTERVKMDAGTLNRILIEIKEKNGWNWNKLAETLGVCEHTIHSWCRAESTIPKPLFCKIESLKGKKIKFIEILAPNWGQAMGGINAGQKKAAILPSTATPEFAELYGAMLGDGCVYSNKESICITSNAIQDKWYVEQYLASICYKLFKTKPKIYFAKNENTIRLVINSRKIAKFFIEQGFPAGKKNLQPLEIPKQFFEDKNLLAACLRGFVDTDGGVHPHPHTKIMLGVTSKSPMLITSLKNAFNTLKIQIGKSKNCLQIYGSNKMAVFFSIIGTSNPRNILRYKHFLDQGRVLTAKETERLLKDGKYQFNVPFMSP